MKKYNLYINFFNGLRWRSITIDKAKYILFSEYSDLIKHIDEKLFHDLVFEFMLEKDFEKMTFKNGKNFISIRKA